MKIAVSSKGLKGLLSDVLKLGTGDATHPGFSLMHLDVSKKGALRATVVNAQAAVRMALAEGGEGHEPGAVAVPLKSMEMVANVLRPDDTMAHVTMVDMGAGRAPVMRMKADDVLLKFPTMSIDDVVPFPTMPDGASVPWCKVSGASLQAIVKHCLWCCAPPTSERPNLQGLHMTPTFVEAADGHRLIQLAIAGVVNAECIVPAPMLAVAASLVGADGDARLVVDGNRVWVQGRSFVMSCRTIDGQYPDTSTIYMVPGDDGLVHRGGGVGAGMARVNEAQLSQPNMWSAATNMTKIFSGGAGKDNRPVLKFMMRDGDLNVFMKSETGQGVDLAQRVMWKGGEKHAPGPEAFNELNALLLDAQYVSQVVGSMPKQDFMRVHWTTSRDRIQFSAGDVRALIMPRG